MRASLVLFYAWRLWNRVYFMFIFTFFVQLFLSFFTRPDWTHNFLYRSIWPIDETLTGITTLVQNGPGDYGNKKEPHTPQSSKTGVSSSDAISWYNIFLVGSSSLQGIQSAHFKLCQLGFWIQFSFSCIGCYRTKSALLLTYRWGVLEQINAIYLTYPRARMRPKIISLWRVLTNRLMCGHHKKCLVLSAFPILGCLRRHAKQLWPGNTVPPRSGDSNQWHPPDANARHEREIKRQLPHPRFELGLLISSSYDYNCYAKCASNFAVIAVR